MGFSYNTGMNMKNNRGFTLIELLVTVAVLIVLLVVGVPEYRRMTENNRQVAAINAIVGDLNLARTVAARMVLPVIPQTGKVAGLFLSILIGKQT